MGGGSLIAEQTGIRDYIAGEKVLQGFLAAHQNLSQLYALVFHGWELVASEAVEVEPGQTVSGD